MQQFQHRSPTTEHIDHAQFDPATEDEPLGHTSPSGMDEGARAAERVRLRQGVMHVRIDHFQWDYEGEKRKLLVQGVSLLPAPKMYVPDCQFPTRLSLRIHPTDITQRDSLFAARVTSRAERFRVSSCEIGRLSGSLPSVSLRPAARR